ncbi:MAG: tetratricopeptide repeat protein [Myxococcota bacterium]
MSGWVPGATFGRSALVRPLGRGANGEVWEAVLNGPRGFRKPVALKMLLGAPDDGGGDDESLIHEARVGALLHHPNVVGVYELGEHDGRWFVAMELVRGASLAALAGGGPLPPSAVLEVGVQLCAGLAYIHGTRIGGTPAGLVHRDVKPSNLLLDAMGHVKLVDLGIWGFAGASGERSGTPGYMSPEQAAGRPQDARSDLFSAGVTLYAIATATRPFGPRADVLAAVEGVEALLGAGWLDPVEAAVPGLGPVIRRCVRYDPADRWGTAIELGAALAALRHRHPRGPTPLQVLRRFEPGLVDPSSEDEATELVRHASVPVPGNLPPPRDGFVGRATELAAIHRAFADGGRLLSLLGLGGAGKTRVALEAARALGPALAGGAWWFDLAEARTPVALCFAVAQGLALQLDGGSAAEANAVARVGEALAARGAALFVFDNLEQAGDAAGAVVSAWLAAAPDAIALCTSRVALRIHGEVRIPIGPLSLADGVALFDARSPRKVAVDRVERLVAAVDGSPLALELLAARSRLLSDDALVDGLALRLVAGGGPDRPDRHRSLAAALDGSFALLSPAAAAAMAQLTVFDGGFRLEGAIAVVDVPGAWLVDLLEELVDANLVQLDDGRFTVRPLVHQHAAARLVGVARAKAEARHGAHFAQLGNDEAIAALAGYGGVARARALTDEADNLLSAFRRAVARDDREVAVGAALAAAAVLGARGPMSTAIEVLRTALSIAADRRLQLLVQLTEVLSSACELEAATALATGALDEARQHRDRRIEAILRLQLGWLAWTTAPAEAEGWFRDALAVAIEAGDRSVEAKVRNGLGVVWSTEGRFAEALDQFEQAVAIFRQLGDLKMKGHVLNRLGATYNRRGILPEARQCYEAALRSARAIDNRMLEGMVLGNLANTLRRLGAWDEAAEIYLVAIPALRRVGARGFVGSAVGNLGLLRWEQGELDEARARVVEALAIDRAVHNPRAEAYFLGRLGLFDLEQGRLADARTHLDAALALARQLGTLTVEGTTLRALAVVERQVGAAERAVVCAKAALAAARDLGEREAEAEAHLVLGDLAADAGQSEVARSRYEAARVLGAETTNPGIELAAWIGLGALRVNDRPDEARTAIDRAVALARDSRAIRGLGVALCARAALALALGDPAGCRAALDEAEGLLRRIDDRLTLARAATIRARVELEADPAQAAARMAEVEAVVAALGATSRSPLGRALAEAQAEAQGRFTPKG